MRWSPSSDVSVYVGGLVGVGAVLAVSVASSFSGRGEKATAGWCISQRRESGAGWWRDPWGTVALPGAGVNPPAPSSRLLRAVSVALLFLVLAVR